MPGQGYQRSETLGLPLPVPGAAPFPRAPAAAELRGHPGSVWGPGGSGPSVRSRVTKALRAIQGTALNALFLSHLS